MGRIPPHSGAPPRAGGLVRTLVPRSGMPLRGRKDMFNLYILRSLKTNRYYIGQTSNLDQRLSQHNQRLVRSTKSGAPWRVVYRETFLTRGEAMRREREIKNFKGGIKFKKLLGLWKE